MFVCEARTKDRSIIRFEPTNTFLGRAELRIRRHQIQPKLSPSIDPFSERFEPFRIDRSEFGTDIVSQLPAHDIVNLHGVASLSTIPPLGAAASGTESPGDGLSRASLPLIQGRKPELHPIQVSAHMYEKIDTQVEENHDAGCRCLFRRIRPLQVPRRRCRILLSAPSQSLMGGIGWHDHHSESCASDGRQARSGGGARARDHNVGDLVLFGE